MEKEQQPSNTALVIDDDPLIISFFSSHLKKMGFTEVEGVLTVNDGVGRLKSGWEPSLIICDLNMPEEDGFDFLSYVAQTGLTVPVIVCSGSGDHLRRSLDNMLHETIKNFVCTLAKPVDMFELAEAVLKARELAVKPMPKPQMNAPSLEEVLNGIDVYFQPKYCSRTMRMLSAEALARVRLEDGTMVFPGLFLPVIRDSGSSYLFTLGVIRQAIDYIGQLSGDKKNLHFAINIGIQDLHEEDFHEEVMELVRRSGIATSRISFEITEDEIYQNDLDVMITMGRLIIDGFNLSLDDFGTGFSNFERLKNLPINELKLDRLFVDRLDVDVSARNLVAAFLEIARSLQLKTVAEGVETREQLEILRLLGADMLQGYYLSLPLPFSEFRALPITYEASENG